MDNKNLMWYIFWAMSDNRSLLAIDAFKAVHKPIVCQVGSRTALLMNCSTLQISFIPRLTEILTLQVNVWDQNFLVMSAGSSLLKRLSNHLTTFFPSRISFVFMKDITACLYVSPLLGSVSLKNNHNQTKEYSIHCCMQFLEYFYRHS